MTHKPVADLSSPITSRADWLAMRKQDATASEIGALFGIHPYVTALEVWADHSGIPTKSGDNLAMKRGRIFEPAVAEAAREEWNMLLVKSERYHRATKLRIGCTPDYLDDAGDPVELKFVQPEVFEKMWQSGPPLAYVLQCLTQIYLLGAARGWIVAMVDNRKKDISRYEVPRNDEAWAKIVAKVAEFWQLVESKTMPAPVFSADLEALKRIMPPDPQAEPIDLTEDNMLPVILDERETLKAKVDECSARIEAIDAEIVHKLAGAPEGRARGWRVTHKQQTRKEYTVKASTFSVLRLTKLKGE